MTDHTTIVIRNVTPKERKAKHKRGVIELGGGTTLVTVGSLHAPYSRDLIEVGLKSRHETATSAAKTAEAVRGLTGRMGGTIGIGTNRTVSPKLAGLGLVVAGTGIVAHGRRLRNEARQGR